jgi:hypothetical protein
VIGVGDHSPDNDVSSMGMELIRGSEILNLSVASWDPRGNDPSCSFGYTTNDRQRVSDEDAYYMASVLYGAIAAGEVRAEIKPYQRSALAPLSRTTDFLKTVAAFIDEGELAIA